MKNSVKGALFIAIGAASYGVLATTVKFANNTGVSTAELTFSQFLFGAAALTILAFFQSKKQNRQSFKSTLAKRSKRKLMIFGTSLGLTSSFYYLSIQFVPVSVGIVLLMQTTWMGVILEFFIDKGKKVNRTKVAGAVVTLLGTALAAKLFESNFSVNFWGIGFGLLAALSYTVAIYASNKVALQLSAIVRSQYLVYGGLLAVILFWNIRILENFDWIALFQWGAFLGFFGTILPPVLYSKGFPETGTGLGSIISALEIPVSVLSAHFVLNEEISILQWLGIAIILFSIIIVQRQNK